MTIRLLVDGRGSLRRQILDQLVAQSRGRIELACHFGDRDSDFHAACLQRMEVRRGRKGHLIEAHQSRGANIPLLASPDFQWMLEQGIEQLHRTGPNYRYRSHNLTHVQDYLDYYHILADAYAQQIEETGATHALFLNMPHLGYDVILYHVARTLGLKTMATCLQPEPMPRRCRSSAARPPISSTWKIVGKSAVRAASCAQRRFFNYCATSRCAIPASSSTQAMSSAI